MTMGGWKKWKDKREEGSAERIHGRYEGWKEGGREGYKTGGRKDRRERRLYSMEGWAESIDTHTSVRVHAEEKREDLEGGSVQSQQLAVTSPLYLLTSAADELRAKEKTKYKNITK